MNKTLSPLLSPTKLWSRAEILQRPCPVPDRPGVYAWYFKQIPPLVPMEGCITWQGLTLLYVGISPSKPTQERGNLGKRNLRKRIQSHLNGNAYGSTLRRTLGCLLSDQLNIRLALYGRKKRGHFGPGEEILSEWMGENAFVTWLVHDEPWIHEDELIKTVNLPLNLRGNEPHPFYPILSAIRKECAVAVLADVENSP